MRRTDHPKIKTVKKFKDIKSVEKNDWVVLKARGDLLVYVVRAADRGASGFISDCGRTNHGVIAAKELGLPFYMGDIEKIFNDNILVKERKPQLKSKNVETSSKVFINLGFPKRTIAKNPFLPEVADGVGFARIEFVILEITSGRHPIEYIAKYGTEKFENEIYNHFKDAVGKFEGKRFWIRTDDFSPNQLLTLKGGKKYESGTFDELVGFRGIARAIDNNWRNLGNFESKLAGISWINIQFKAINRLAKDFFNTKLGIFAPMVHDVSEYKKWLSLGKKIIKNNIDWGVMVEVPAITGNGIKPFLAENLIDFMIIGSNDLTALMLGIDRTDLRFGQLFNEENPSVLGAMIQTIKLCKKNKVLTAIGGEAASKKSLMTKLYSCGIDIYSVTPNAETIYKSRQHLANLDKKVR